jgi:hypothetical protein
MRHFAAIRSARSKSGCRLLRDRLGHSMWGPVRPRQKQTPVVGSFSRGRDSSEKSPALGVSSFCGILRLLGDGMRDEIGPDASVR